MIVIKQDKSFYLNSFSAMSLISAVIVLEDKIFGKELYEKIINYNVPLDLPLLTALINMYNKFNDFDMVFQLYYQMKKLNIKPDSVAYTCLITTCFDSKHEIFGKQIHQ